jgi:flagellar basal-body rod modification protein FlgD
MTTLVPLNGVTAGAVPPNRPAANGAAELQNQFMQLLLIQLRNQSPLDPLKDREFMSQLTQLNSLQELQKLNLALQSFMQASQLRESAHLIGREVDVKADDGLTRTGLVKGASLEKNGVLLILADGTTAPLTDVVAVRAPATSPAPTVASPAPVGQRAMV